MFHNGSGMYSMRPGACTFTELRLQPWLPEAWGVAVPRVVSSGRHSLPHQEVHFDRRRMWQYDGLHIATADTGRRALRRTHMARCVREIWVAVRERQICQFVVHRGSGPDGMETGLEAQPNIL